MENASLEAYQAFLQKRNEALHVPTKPPPKRAGEDPDDFFARSRYIEPTPRNARSLLELTKQLKNTQARRFLTNEYVYENLAAFLQRSPEDYLRIDPKRVAQALEVKDKLTVLSHIYGFEPQYMPAITTCGYAAAETIRTSALESLEGAALKDAIARLREEERMHARDVYAQQKDRKGTYVYARGKAMILRFLARYAQTYKPKEDGHFEDYVLRSLSKDLYKKLRAINEETALLDQSQGYEIEVLKRVTASRSAVRRGVDSWLPRGIPMDKHARSDWQLIPLFAQGLHEDIGERRYQVFEVSSDPSESMPVLTSSIMALTAAGFFTEDALSDIFEGYSLHVSSVFPRSVIHKESLAQYRQYARALSLAYASRQRIGFGGFMSGGSEVSDKSDAGTLRDIQKVKDPAKRKKLSVPGDRVLLEIRNLDLTSRSHFKALNNKQYLDFAFTAYWQHAAAGGQESSPLQTRAAAIWQEFIHHTTELFESKGIKTDTNNTWKEMSDAASRDSTFQKDAQVLIGQAVRNIRDAVSHYHQEEQTKHILSQTHHIVQEPLSRKDDRVYLSKDYRRRLGVAAGDVLRLMYGEAAKECMVAPSYLRGNGELDASDTIRVSPNVLGDLRIPAVSGAGLRFDKDTRTLSLLPREHNGDAVLIQHPRPISIEAKSMHPDRMYLSRQDRMRLGVRPGETITVRMGTMKKTVRVAQEKLGGSGGGNINVSPNVLAHFNVPQGLPLRLRYDRHERELALGPLIGILNTDTKPERTLFGRRTKMLRQLCDTARKTGVLAVIINPNDPANRNLSRGFVTGYVADEYGAFRKIRVPAPDVIYDRDLYFHMKHTRDEDFESIFPTQLQAVTRSKYRLHEMLAQNEYLRPFLLDTQPLTSKDALAEFLARHERIFLKPNEGQQGLGLLTVEKSEDGYTVHHPYIDHDAWKLTTHTLPSFDALWEVITSYQKKKSTYLMQKYLDLAQVHVGTRTDGTPIVRGIELRHLLQRGADMRLGVVGVVTRLSDKKLIGREYHLDGFEALSKAFSPDQARHIMEQSKRLSLAITHYLEDVIGKPIGELTLDIGVSRQGKLYVIEANSKAETRGLFEEAGNADAAHASVTNPIFYATALAGYAPS